MSNMVTRCPKCATSFRITSAQLQSAKGAVRCGSCLHIFKAQDHLLSGEAPVATPPLVRKPAVANQQTSAARAAAQSAPAVKKPSAPKPATSSGSPSPARHSETPITTAPPAAPQKANAPQTTVPPQPAADKLLFNQTEIDEEIAALGDDDILISDDMDQKSKDDGFEFDEFLNIDAKPAQSTSLFERNARDSKKDSHEEADESWAESLLEEADEEARFDQVRQQSATAETGASAALRSDEDDELFDYTDQQPPAYDPQAKDPVFSLIDDNSAAENHFRKIFSEKELSEEIRAINHEEVYASAPPGAPDIPLRAYDTSRAALLMNIMPEPVVMTSRRKRSWYQRKLWTLLSLLMLILLVIQVAWMQFDNLSRIHPYRAAYQFICPAIGCTVPTLIDRSKIRVRNLLVRKHPDLADALIVDVIVLNNAPFEQPFPDLVMAFSDIDGQPLAARRFTPREYLAGELAGIKLMPQNQPIHISMELVDPGEEAVNYKIEPY